MHRCSMTIRRTCLAIALTFAASLAMVTSGAQAIVVDMNPSAHGQPSVSYPTDQSSYYGVSLVPPVSGITPDIPSLASAGVPYVTTSGACVDPALPSDLTLPSTGLCSHGGSVIHNNETFALTWDPDRRYWQTTRNYVEQFLSNVASGSGTFTSPYSITGQYTDAGGHAANASLYGGACIDYGSVGGSTCQFGNANGTGPGYNYPATGCTLPAAQWGLNVFAATSNGPIGTAANDVCLTDAQIQGELATMISQTGMLGHTKPGYGPVVVMLTPPGVVVCLDAAGHLCSANGSANSGATAQFCSYHSQVNVAGTEVPYVVQPWTAQWGQGVMCDEPDAPKLQLPIDISALATDVAKRLVSPISQGHIAAIVNPGLNGWFGNPIGVETNDNGCIPLGNSLDAVTVGSGSYFLQREFNNAGVIESDPNALGCIDWTTLSPAFVVPSSVNVGDVVELDGSTSPSSLIVPKNNYWWSFGDGATAVGPSVVHTYTNGGAYAVTLTITDRGGNSSTLSQTIDVLGPNGKPGGGGGGGTGAGGGSGSGGPLTARLQLLPQSLRSMLRGGVSIQLISNEAANGFVTVSISRSAAKRAHIKAGRGPSVVIGRGTVSGLQGGTASLHLRLSNATIAKLKRLRNVKLTIKLTLFAANGTHVTIDAAGNY
jgi:PKD domain